MSESEVLNPLTETAETVVATATLEEVPRTRKRPKPGERREQILQALAAMLEKPGFDAPTFKMDGSITDFYKFTKDSFRMENYRYHEFPFEIPMAI